MALTRLETWRPLPNSYDGRLQASAIAGINDSYRVSHDMTRLIDRRPRQQPVMHGLASIGSSQHCLHAKVEQMALASSARPVLRCHQVISSILSGVLLERPALVARVLCNTLIETDVEGIEWGGHDVVLRAVRDVPQF